MFLNNFSKFEQLKYIDFSNNNINDELKNNFRTNFEKNKELFVDF